MVLQIPHSLLCVGIPAGPHNGSNVTYPSANEENNMQFDWNNNASAEHLSIRWRDL